MTEFRFPLDKIPESSATVDHSLRLPLIPDPGKTEDATVAAEKLDFAVRLGSSLARGQESDERRVAKELRLIITADGGGILQDTPTPKPTPSPRSPRWGAKTSRSRRESRRSSVLKVEEIVVPEVNIETARMKLHRVLNTVKIITSVCLALKKYVQACQTKNWSFMEMYLHVKEDLNQLVAFNPHNFARVEPESLKLRKLLSKPGPTRTVKDVKVILALIRGNTSFQDYPTHVQLQLARCMTYQSYEARRVILKQGHRAEAFYILLSGSVIANVEERSKDSGKSFVKTVKEMGPGDTFGEIALIEGGRRTASIVCKTAVELLVILKDDFDSIIRAPLLQQIDEHVQFCRTMALFKDFPCEALAENPSQFFYHYFKKDDVVVKNSKESKYIIVVKAGKCRIICTLPDSAKRKRKVASAAMKKDMDTAFPNYDDLKKITSFNRKQISDADKLKNTICLGLLTGKIDRTRLADHGPDVQRPKTSMTHNELERRLNKPVLKKSKSLNNFLEVMATERRQKVKTDDDLYTQTVGNFWSTRLKHVLKSKKRVTTPVGTTVTQRTPSRVSIRTTSSRTRQSTRQSSRPSTTNAFYDTENYTYAQIAELQAGTVFGLESLVQKPAVTFSLVSEGAECIFISKRLFLNLANLKVLRVVTDMIQTYPSVDYIQEQVRNYRYWMRYKNCLVHGVLNKSR